MRWLSIDHGVPQGQPYLSKVTICKELQVWQEAGIFYDFPVALLVKGLAKRDVASLVNFRNYMEQHPGTGGSPTRHSESTQFVGNTQFYLQTPPNLISFASPQ